jgi:hypothetical protein
MEGSPDEAALPAPFMYAPEAPAPEAPPAPVTTTTSPSATSSLDVLRPAEIVSYLIPMGAPGPMLGIDTGNTSTRSRASCSTPR